MVVFTLTSASFSDDMDLDAMLAAPRSYLTMEGARTAALEDLLQIIEVYEDGLKEAGRKPEPRQRPVMLEWVKVYGDESVRAADVYTGMFYEITELEVFQ